MPSWTKVKCSIEVLEGNNSWWSRWLDVEYDDVVMWYVQWQSPTPHNFTLNINCNITGPWEVLRETKQSTPISWWLEVYKHDTSRSREAVYNLNIHDMGTLLDINKKEKVRTPYWEAFTLDRTWQPPPRRNFTTKSTFGAQVCYASEKKNYLFATQFATRL